jgi:hypothetical protein
LAQVSRRRRLFIMGDDIGWFNIGAYHRGNDVRQNAEPR